MTYDSALLYSKAVKPYKWLIKNLTVTRDGCYGITWIKFVAEPGYEDGVMVNDVTIVFTERK
jgi:hypothetical protein